MSENKKSKIRVGDVKGDVIVSQNQSSGTTTHTVVNKPEKKSFVKWIIIVIGLAASLVTILTYFSIKPNKGVKMKTHDNNSIVVGDVQGNVVVSQNQTGGITAHSITINEVQSPEWSLTPSEKVEDNEWRAKLNARGVGKLAFYNWNILLTLNTPVIRREDVSGEVSVGPWMPLKISGGNLQPNQFFLGFSEFKPGQTLGIYLYTKEPIKVLRVDTIE